MFRQLRIRMRQFQRLFIRFDNFLKICIILFMAVIFVIHSNGYRNSDDEFVPSPRLGFRSQNHQNEINQNRMTKRYDNETGADRFVVPNIIHFVRFKLSEYSFIDYIVLKAAMRNHRPDHFFIHTDTPIFSGKYWDLIQKDHELWSRIRIIERQLPDEVFGQQLSEDFKLFHGSDFERIRIMMEYGGIYLDNDIFLLKNLDKYRKFEMVMTWSEGAYLENQIIICNKNAGFLGPWLETYRVYKDDEWYYNGGVRPTTEILNHRPELMHRVKGWFGHDSNMVRRIYEDKDFDDWRRYDAIHLLIGHRHYLDRNYNATPEFNEHVIKHYPYPFGTMVREVLDESPGIRDVSEYRQ